MADDTKTVPKAADVKGWTVRIPLDVDGKRVSVGEILTADALKQDDAAALIDIGVISAA